MIINFNGDISKQEVQEMIDAAVDFTTGVLNLSYATSGQVQEALADPNRWLFSIDYSGMTYMQRYSQRFTDSTAAYFYVMGATPDSFRRRIFDRILYASIDNNTYEISTGSTDYVPDVIYNLNNMNVEQLKVLYDRTKYVNTKINGRRYGAIWEYNSRKYIYSARFPDVGGNGIYLLGTAAGFNSSLPPVIYYDMVVIDSGGTVTHTEYTSNIQLTPVQ